MPAVRPDEPGRAILQVGPGLDHVEGGDALGDRHHHTADPASVASMMASPHRREATKTTETFAPVSRTASSTVSRREALDRSAAFPGVTLGRPTTFVP